jgi:hypothetical protein
MLALDWELWLRARRKQMMLQVRGYDRRWDINLVGLSRRFDTQGAAIQLIDEAANLEKMDSKDTRTSTEIQLPLTAIIGSAHICQRRKRLVLQKAISSLC